MHRFAIAAAALLFALHGASGATRKVVHRLSPMPGFSLTLPDGWMACDAASNRALGNAPHVIVMEKLCKSMEAKSDFHALGTTVLVDSDPATHTMLLVTHSNAFVLPDEYFTDATSQFLDEANKDLCNEVRKTLAVSDDCTFRAGEVGGRPAFIADAKAVPGDGQAFAARLYVVSAAAGTAIFAFVTPGPASVRAQSAIDDITRSMKIMPPQPPPPPGAPISLSPLPGVTLAVPNGWVACDDANDALLGRKADPLGAKTSLCAEVVPGQIVRLFDPHAPYFESVEIQATAVPNPDALAQRIAPDRIAKDRDEHCATLSKPLLDKGLSLTSCDAVGGTVGGHAAQIVTIFAHGRPDLARFSVNVEVRATMVLVGKQAYFFTLTTSSALQPKFDAAGAAIADSIAFQ